MNPARPSTYTAFTSDMLEVNNILYSRDFVNRALANETKRLIREKLGKQLRYIAPAEARPVAWQCTIPNGERFLFETDGYAKYFAEKTGGKLETLYTIEEEKKKCEHRQTSHTILPKRS